VLTVKWDPRASAHIDTLRPTFDREVEWARGQRLAIGDDRLVATFDGPGRAVRCGATVLTVGRQAGVAARAGVHIGERHLAGRRDPIIDISAHLADAAPPGEIYVSRTVVDLVPGSGIQFEERGLLHVPTAAGELAVLSVIR
jgi:class 3 adenylate cyclase